MDFKSYAEKYYELGLNVSCTSYIKNKYNHNTGKNETEKSPSHKWIDLQIRRQNLEEIDNYPWEYSTGVGCIIGHNRIKCIDIDGCSNNKIVIEIIRALGLPKDYEWIVKTPNGFHIYIQSEELYFSYKALDNGVLSLAPNEKNKNEFKRIELRWSEHCILPPSKISTVPYSFFNQSETPKNEIKYVNLISLIKSICQMCGTSTHYHYDENRKEIISGYKGEIKIDNYSLKVLWSSGSGYYLQQHQNNNLILDANQYSGANWIEIQNHVKPERNIFIDIETTGLIDDELDYENYPRIIQLSYIQEDKYGIRENNFYIKPIEFDLEEEITELTGITEDLLEEKGITIESALSCLSMINSNAKSCKIISHNLNFDFSILDSEYLRLGKRNPLRDLNTFCTMKTMSDLLKSKYLKLSELYEYLFEEPVSTQLHNAYEDVKILKDCYRLMDLYGYTK